MNVGIYQSAASLAALERWQSIVTQNISSGGQTAYKRRVASFDAADAGEVLTDRGTNVDSGQGAPAVFPTANASISFTPGQIQTTGRNLDVAIQGPGFFELKLSDGSKVYTRDGSFLMNAKGVIVGAGGAEVLTDRGDPITLQPGKGKLVIDEHGRLFQGGKALGQLAVVNFPDPSNLIPLSANVFAGPPGVDPQQVGKPQVAQGNLEDSNTSPLREMVDLVTISRAYEANQKVITNRDDVMNKTLDAFG